jgi:hypothetical protein
MAANQITARNAGGASQLHLDASGPAWLRSALGKMTLIRQVVLALAVGGLTGCSPFSHSRNNASDLFQRKADRTVLEAIPQMRHEALVRCAEREGGDTTPERFEKQQHYIKSLAQLLRKLYDAYYWWDEYPKDLEATVNQQARYLAMLEVPARGGLRGEAYEAAIYRHTIRIYEDMIVTAARGICNYLTEDGVAVSYEAWKSSWDDAAKVQEPNKPDAVNPAMALRFAIEGQWRRVTDLERS